MPALRDLEIRHLVALDAVATEGTFGRAAERLGYTQSAISQQIAALERLVERQVVRSSRRSAAGRAHPARRRGARRRPRPARPVSSAASHRIDRFRSGEIGQITVGTFQSTSAAVLPLVIGRLREKFPGAEVRLFETDHDFELFEGIANGDLDVSFVVGDIGPGLEARHLMEDPLVLLRPDGRFPAGPVDAAQRSPRSRRSVSTRTPASSRARWACARPASCPNYVFRTNDNGTVAAMVRAGMGVAYMPALCVDPFDGGISVHATEPLAAAADDLDRVACRAARMSPVAEHFVDITVDVCAELVENARGRPGTSPDRRGCQAAGIGP